MRSSFQARLRGACFLALLLGGILLVFGLASAHAESPLVRGLIWTGSNDGPIYVTRDTGKTFVNFLVVIGLPGMLVRLEPFHAIAVTCLAS